MASLGFHRNGSWTLWRMLAEYVTTQIIYPTFSWFPSESFQNSSIWDWNYFVSNVIHILFLWWEVVEEKTIRSISNVTFLRSLACLLFTWKQEFIQLHGTLRIKEKLSCQELERPGDKAGRISGQAHIVCTRGCWISLGSTAWLGVQERGQHLRKRSCRKKLPWLFCELLERMHPNQKSFFTLPFPFALLFVPHLLKEPVYCVTQLGLLSCLRWQWC